NSSSNVWDDFLGSTGTYATSSNTATIMSGTVTSVDFYRSWGLFNDSAEVTHVAGITNVSGIRLYPNPGNGVFTVSGIAAGQVVELYDYLGQLLSNQVAENSSSIHFDLSAKANGVYLLRIQNRDGSVATVQKIVKTE